MNTRRDESASAGDLLQLQSGVRRKDKKFTRGDAEKMSANELASTGGGNCRLTPIRLRLLKGVYKPLLLCMEVVKAEQVHQIANRWTIQRNVGVVRVRYRIVEIVAAAIG